MHKDIEAAFTEKLKKTILQFYGENPQKSNDYNRIINKKHFDRLNNLLKAHESDVIHGGKTDESDLFIAPTLIKNPSLHSELMKEEIFGPLLPIIPIDNVESAIQFINGKPKPLALYVFSTNAQVQNTVVYYTSSGGVGINECIMHVCKLYAIVTR